MSNFKDGSLVECVKVTDTNIQKLEIGKTYEVQDGACYWNSEKFVRVVDGKKSYVALSSQFKLIGG